jgi:hypothetical protein
MARCGDVMWLYDATAARDPKLRMFVCLDPAQGWCARVLSREPRHGGVPIAAAEYSFLSRDSYIETGMPIEMLEDEINQGRRAGQISTTTAQRIVAAWERSLVTPPCARDAVITELKSTFGIK